MRYIPIILILFFLVFGYTRVGASQDKDIDCLVAVEESMFVAYFPVKDKNQKIWAWNIKKKKGGFPYDYTWTAEPGYIDRKGGFEHENYAFGLAHWNDGGFRNKATGSLEDLVEDTGGRGSIYLNSQEGSRRAEEDKRLQLWEIPIQSAYRDGGVLITSKSTKAKELLFSGKPTHIRMTVNTPYISQNYQCLTLIDYLY